MAPMLKSTREVLEQWMTRFSCPDFVAKEFFEPANNVRKEFAALIGVSDADSIALTPSASYGISVAARNTPVDSRQNIVVLHNQFLSNYYAWRKLADSTGAELRVVDAPRTTVDRGEKWNAEILDAIDSSTAVVAMPHVHWMDGTIFDIGAVSKKVHEQGGRLVIDGTQSIGAYPFNQDEVRADAIICSGYKWLLSPFGIGLAYFGQVYEEGEPLEENWINRKGSENFSGLQYTPEYQPGALRYDAGGKSNFLHTNALANALKQINAWGVRNIKAYCQQLVEPFASMISSTNIWIENSNRRASHLFGLRLPDDMDISKVTQELAARDIRTSVRGTAIRVSPHLYNTNFDMQALAEVLHQLQ